MPLQCALDKLTWLRADSVDQVSIQLITSFLNVHFANPLCSDLVNSLTHFSTVSKSLVSPSHDDYLPVMKDPTIDMDNQNNTMLKRQSPNVQAEPRRNPNKTVRVAFGPDIETHIPPHDKSPAPNHHRSFTTFDQKFSVTSPSSGRPTSSGGDSVALVTEERPRLTSDVASDSGRPTAALKRARSDYGPRVEFDKSLFGDDDEDDFAMRHGWQEEYTSSEYLKVLHSVSRIFWLLSAATL